MDKYPCNDTIFLYTNRCLVSFRNRLWLITTMSFLSASWYKFVVKGSAKHRNRSTDKVWKIKWILNRSYLFQGRKFSFITKRLLENAYWIFKCVLTHFIIILIYSDKKKTMSQKNLWLTFHFVLKKIPSPSFWQNSLIIIRSSKNS